ncbi:hypothetical protein LEMLEM_LOCUS13448 [Lemmus lemmus]
MKPVRPCTKQQKVNATFSDHGPWRTLKNSSGYQSSIRNTRHFHAMNTGQEQRDQLCQDVASTQPSQVPPPKMTPTNKPEAVLRICHPNSFSLWF